MTVAGSGFVAARNIRQQARQDDGDRDKNKPRPRPRPDTPATKLVVSHSQRGRHQEKRKRKKQKKQEESSLPEIGHRSNSKKKIFTRTHGRGRFVHRVRYAVYG